MMKSFKRKRVLALALAIMLTFSGRALPVSAQDAAVISGITVATEVIAGTSSIPITVSGSGLTNESAKISVSWKMRGALTDAGSGQAVPAVDGKTASFSIPVGINNSEANIYWEVTVRLGETVKTAVILQKARVLQQEAGKVAALSDIGVQQEIQYSSTNVPFSVNGTNLSDNTQLIVTCTGGDWANAAISSITQNGLSAVGSVVIPVNNTENDIKWTITVSIAGTGAKTAQFTQKAPAPSIAPVVTGINPSADVEYPGSNFTINFSTNMKSEGSVSIAPNSNGEQVTDFSVNNSQLSVSVSGVQADTNYTLTLTGFSASDGAPLTANTATFKTKAAPVIAPVVDSITPDANVEYANPANLTIAFSKAMKDEGSISIAPNNGSEQVSKVSIGGKQLIASVSGLKADTVYALTLTGFKDTDGSELTDNKITFRTKAAPAAAPKIASSNPGDGANVSKDLNTVSITFDSTPVTNTGTVTMTGGGLNKALSIKNISGKTYTYELPTLNYSTTYSLTVKDFENNGTIMIAKTIAFTTAAAGKPVISSTVPAENAITPASTTKLTITFSMDMETAKNALGTASIRESGQNVSTALSYVKWIDKRTVEYTLPDLAGGKTYTLEITSFKNEAGQVMDKAAQNFSVTALPYVKNITPSGENVSVSNTVLTLEFDRKMNKNIAGSVTFDNKLLPDPIWTNDYTVTYKLPELSSNKIYNIVIKSFKDNDGTMIAETQKSFKTIATAKPAVSSIEPARNATVPVNTEKLVITFNMDMNTNANARGAINVKRSDQAKWTTLSFYRWANDKTAEYYLPVLESGKTYNVEVTGFKSSAGQVMDTHTQSFYTSVTPLVSKVTPSGEGVSVNTSTITIEFDRKMNKNTTGAVTAGGVTLTGAAWTSDYAVRYNLPVLSSNKSYNVVISSFKDTAGNIMTTETKTFKTGSGTTTKPLISSISPFGSDVSINTAKLTITFNKPMNSSFGAVSMSKNISLSKVNWKDEYTVEYTMSTLNDYTDYTVTVKNFRDTSGNIMEETTRTFKTEYRSGYWVTYNSNGGSGTMSGNPYKVSDGSNHKVYSNNFYRTNYEFVEWNTRSNGNGTGYDHNDTVYNVRDNIDLYAIWQYTGSSSGNKNNSGSNVSPSGSGSTVSGSTSKGSIENQLDRNNDPSLNLSSKAESVEITGRVLNKVLDSGRPLSISKDEMSVKMSSAFINNLIFSNSDDIEIDIKPISQSINDSIVNVDRDNKELAKLAFDVSLRVSGRNCSDFTEGLELSVDLSDLNLTSRQKENLTGVRFDSYGNVQQLGGECHGNTFTFRTSKLSKYGVLITDDITEIFMNVGSTSFSVNGASRRMDAAPTIRNDRTMVPVRFVAEALGADVGWHEGTRTVTIYLNGKTVTLTIGMLSGGMDVAPYIESDRTYVPIRYIAENFGANVVWKQEDRSIEIVR